MIEQGKKIHSAALSSLDQGCHRLVWDSVGLCSEWEVKCRKQNTSHRIRLIRLFESIFKHP